MCIFLCTTEFINYICIIDRIIFLNIDPYAVNFLDGLDALVCFLDLCIERNLQPLAVRIQLRCILSLVAYCQDELAFLPGILIEAVFNFFLSFC